MDNSFVVVGHSGYGKSTLCKALTGNEKIKISLDLKGCTKKISFYSGEFKKINGKTKYFAIIDTPGLDDSDGRDKEFYSKLREMMQTKNMKIKGVFITFNFQTNRFGQSEKTIITKILDLVPIREIWKYITIVVTHFYYNPKKLEDKKKNLEKNLKELFEKEFIKYGFNKYAIMGKFEDIKIVYVNFDDENPTINEAKDIKEIIENSLTKEPLFSESSESTREKVPVIDYDDLSHETVSLYNCTVKTIIYYGQNRNTLNEIRIITEKKEKRVCNISEISPNKNFITSGTFVGLALISLAGFAFPPLEIPAIITYLGSSIVSGVFSINGLKKVMKYIQYSEKSSFLDESK